MEKIVRIGKISQQDEFRRDDIRKMSPDARVLMLLSMQSASMGWDKNPKFLRMATIKRTAIQK